MQGDWYYQREVNEKVVTDSNAKYHAHAHKENIMNIISSKSRDFPLRQKETQEIYSYGDLDDSHEEYSGVDKPGGRGKHLNTASNFNIIKTIPKHLVAKVYYYYATILLNSYL